MFDSAGISSDYTFTKTDEGSLVNISSSGFSGDLGKVGVAKTYTPPIPAPSTPLPSSKDSGAPAHQATNGSAALSEDEELFLDSAKSYITGSFNALASEVGSTGGKIKENQLIAYLKTLMDTSEQGFDNTEEIAFVKNLIANFSTLSNGAGYITSFNGLKDAQDHRTVTKAQVTPPIDVRV